MKQVSGFLFKNPAMPSFESSKSFKPIPAQDIHKANLADRKSVV